MKINKLHVNNGVVYCLPKFLYMENLRLTDESLMPYGQHKGEKVANIPPKDLLWLYDNDRCSAPVRLYIKENLEDLRKDVSY